MRGNVEIISRCRLKTRRKRSEKIRGVQSEVGEMRCERNGTAADFVR